MRAAELAGLAFVAHDRHGQAPAVTGLANNVRRVDPGAVEDHFTELARHAVDIHEIDRMAVRVEQHPTDALVVAKRFAFEVKALGD